MTTPAPRSHSTLVRMKSISHSRSCVPRTNANTLASTRTATARKALLSARPPAHRRGPAEPKP
eukprot:3004821-Pleurochrysis_carterae.AAC.1